MEDELLRALGRRQGEDPSSDSAMTPEGNDADALLRPFDEGERKALLDGVLAQLGKGATPAAPQPVVDPKVVDLQEKRRSPAIVVLAIALTAAAALVLWFVMQPGPRTPGPEVASLPTYAFTEMRGGIAKTRSSVEVPAEVELGAADSIEWTITPKTPVRSAVEVAVLAVPDDGGEPRLVALPNVKVSASGAVRIEGRLAEFVELTPGAWTLTVLISAPGGLPQDVKAAQEPPEGRWRVARARAMIVAP